MQESNLNVLFALLIISFSLLTGCTEGTDSKNTKANILNGDSAFIIKNIILNYWDSTGIDTSKEYIRDVFKPEFLDSFSIQYTNYWRDTIGDNDYVICRIEGVNKQNIRLYENLVFYVKKKNSRQYLFFNNGNWVEDSIYTFDMQNLQNFVNYVFADEKTLNQPDIDFIKKMFLITKVQQLYFFRYPTCVYLVDYYLNRGYKIMPDNYFLNCRNIQEVKDEHDLDSFLKLFSNKKRNLPFPQNEDFSKSDPNADQHIKALHEIFLEHQSKELDQDQKALFKKRHLYLKKQKETVISSLKGGNCYYFYSAPDYRLYKLEIKQDNSGKIDLNGWVVDTYYKPQSFFLTNIEESEEYWRGK